LRGGAEETPENEDSWYPGWDARLVSVS
jgi:hypothetical protein